MVGKLVIVLSFIALCSAATFKTKIAETEPFIVNGTDARIEDYPFAVSLQSRRNGGSYHSCGGSIIDRYWILTAAHCVENANPENYLVEYATTNIANGPNGDKIAYVEKFIWHEKYSPDLNDDIALVKLKTPLDISLPNYIVNLSRTQYATGTPATLDGATSETPETTETTEIPETSETPELFLYQYNYADCQARHNPGWLFYTNTCAGVDEGGKGQCSGDSGGPLLVNGVQTGIVSWSMKPCTIAPYPGVFTDVSHYIHWIEEHTRE